MMAIPSLDDVLVQLVSMIGTLDGAEKVEALNRARLALHEASPFREHPVDLVLWVPAEAVEANDYNPNTVAAPEMELLELSIASDGYTMPIVSWVEADGRRETVDGFHRGLVGKTCEAVRKTTGGYLPVTTVNSERTERSDRVASTIRHNRARGKHQISAMSEIVRDLATRNWSDAKIGRELGMEPDEVLRLKQISGLAELFADREFSRAWEPEE
jgi:ParB-like chromosome segregation protein Spo0J